MGFGMRLCVAQSLFLTMIALMIPTLSNAEGEPGGLSYQFTEGGDSCGHVIQVIEAEYKARPAAVKPDNLYTMSYVKLTGWLEGYLSARNEVSSTYKLVGQRSDSESRSRWLENYCRKNPLETLSNAARAMRDAMLTQDIRDHR